MSPPSRAAQGARKRVVPSLTVENYVKTIALIAARDSSGSAVATGELAQALNVSPGTVTGMLKTLSEANLATYTPYEGARLTDCRPAAGDESHSPPSPARAVPRRDVDDDLGRGPRGSRAHGARRLGKADRPDRRLPRLPGGRPARRPDPRADGSLAETKGVPLARCQPGQHFRVVRVMDQDPAFLRYLSESGLELNATGEILENRPESGAIVCRLGPASIALGMSAAGKVLVTTSSQAQAHQ